MKVYLGADHAGFKLKEQIKRFLDECGFPYEDLGALKLNKNDDYPIYAAKVGKKVASEKTFGLLFCGSSYGICIAANKIKGVRAVTVSDVESARLTRLHNDANVLCLSGWNTSLSKAEKIVKVFLTTMFSKEGRHARRINEIKHLEK